MQLIKAENKIKKIKLGICGEHGGDPKSIEFCAKTGLDYVSCSPYRVPVARLAAAQAQIKKIKSLILNLKLGYYALIHLLIFYQLLLQANFLCFKVTPPEASVSYFPFAYLTAIFSFFWTHIIKKNCIEI